MKKAEDNRRIAFVHVAHQPHVSINTGYRHMTIEHARVEVFVTLDDDSVEKFAVIRTPARGVRKEKKIDQATRGFDPIIGMKWVDVQRVALQFHFLPLGVPWGIQYSGESRWFSCFCGGSTQVDKTVWKQYRDGEVISVTCKFCTLVQDVQQRKTS